MFCLYYHILILKCGVSGMVLCFQFLGPLKISSYIYLMNLKGDNILQNGDEMVEGKMETCIYDSMQIAFAIKTQNSGLFSVKCSFGY